MGDNGGLCCAAAEEVPTMDNGRGRVVPGVFEARVPVMLARRLTPVVED